MRTGNLFYHSGLPPLRCASGSERISIWRPTTTKTGLTSLSQTSSPKPNSWSSSKNLPSSRLWIQISPCLSFHTGFQAILGTISRMLKNLRKLQVTGLICGASTTRAGDRASSEREPSSHVSKSTLRSDRSALLLSSYACSKKRLPRSTCRPYWRTIS